TVARLRTCAAIAGNASIAAGSASIWRPPWFETTRPSTPRDTAFLGVLRMQDALDHQGALPAVAIARHLLPGECARHALARKHRGFCKAYGLSRFLLAARALAHIGQQIGKTRIAVAPQRHQPTR